MGVKISDVIGLDDAKKAVKEAIEIPLQYPELMKKYSIKPINGILFFGPPGTGKTMLTHAVSNEIKGVTMLDISGASLLEQGIDSAMATLKETFNRAKENAPAIVFIDEIDSIFPNRENASEFGIQLTAEALKQLDSTRAVTNVVVIGTTNRPDALDTAILRPGRFDKLIYVGPPDGDSRAKMFETFLKDTPLDEKIDYDKLSDLTKDFTGADISGICDVAKREALENEVGTGEGAKVDMKLLEKVISTKKPSVSKQELKRYTDFIGKYGSR
jgi:transitional endoplasmic reticulum ATPase